MNKEETATKCECDKSAMFCVLCDHCQREFWGDVPEAVDEDALDDYFERFAGLHL